MFDACAIHMAAEYPGRTPDWSKVRRHFNIQRILPSPY